MISWRYHVVSIVAVVLAFGLGILAGTSVSGPFVRTLQDNYDSVVQQRDDLRSAIAILERFATGLQPTLRDGVLSGRAAVVVTMEGVDGPARRTVDELAAGGVDVRATLELTRRLVEADVEDNALILREILDAADAPADVLRRRLIDGLAVRLAVGPTADGDEGDVLGRLLAGGLVTADRDLDAEALLDIGGGGQLVVIATGGSPPADLPGPGALLVPLAERLIQLDVAAAAVGPTDDGYGFVRAVRDATDVPDCALVTVDDIDLTIGGIALVMGLDRFLEDPDPAFRPGGDYGVTGDEILPGAEEVPASCGR